MEINVVIYCTFINSNQTIPYFMGGWWVHLTLFS